MTRLQSKLMDDYISMQAVLDEKLDDLKPWQESSLRDLRVKIMNVLEGERRK